MAARLDIGKLTLIETNTPNFCGIYICLCILTGKYYLGSTINFKQRFIDHNKLLRKKKHHSRHFQSAWNLYGKESFIWYKIRNCKINNLEKIEQFYLDVFQPWNDSIGLNMAKFVESNNRGMKMSQITKERMSKSRKGIKFSEERKRAISDGKRGVPFSSAQYEARKKYIQKLKDDRKPHPNSGKIPSKETRLKIGQANSGENNYNFGKKVNSEKIKQIIDTRCKNQNFFFVRKTDNEFFHTKNITEFCRLNNLKKSARKALRDIWNEIPTLSGQPRFIEFRKASINEIEKFLEYGQDYTPVYFFDLSLTEQQIILNLRKVTRMGANSTGFGKSLSELQKENISNAKIIKCILKSPNNEIVELLTVKDRRNCILSKDQIVRLISGKVKKTQSGWTLISIIK